MAPFFRQNGPASAPAAHNPTALCSRLPLRSLPSPRLARPSLLPFIPPLPAPRRPAESLAWRCVAGALLGFGNKYTRVHRAVWFSMAGIEWEDLPGAESLGRLMPPLVHRMAAHGLELPSVSLHIARFPLFTLLRH